MAGVLAQATVEGMVAGMEGVTAVEMAVEMAAAGPGREVVTVKVTVEVTATATATATVRTRTAARDRGPDPDREQARVVTAARRDRRQDASTRSPARPCRR